MITRQMKDELHKIEPTTCSISFIITDRIIRFLPPSGHMMIVRLRFGEKHSLGPWITKAGDSNDTGPEIKQLKPRSSGR